MPRLAGDLTLVRGWWLLLRFRLGTVAFLVAAVVLIALCGLDVVPGDVTFFVSGASMWSVVELFTPSGVPVTSSAQPRLYELVHAAATRLRVRPPDRVWLGHEAAVVGQARLGRRELVIGLPVAYALSRAELTALVEHELAILATEHAWLSVRLYRRWAEAMDQAVTLDEDESPGRRDAAALRTLAPLADAMEQRADAALTDPGVAVRALIRQARVEVDYGQFSMMVTTQLGRWTWRPRLRYRIQDLHDGWRRRLVAGAGLPIGEIDAAEVDMLADRHPSFQAAARDLVGQKPITGPDPDAVELTALSRRHQRRLAAKEFSAEENRAYWRTFQTAPSRIWRREVARNARRVLDSVGEVLGRESTGRAEAADIVLRRPVEVALVSNPDAEPEEIDAARSQVVDWLDLLEDALFDCGWVRVDPAVPGILCGPGGKILDGTDLARRATADPIAYAELRRLLADPV